MARLISLKGESTSQIMLFNGLRTIISLLIILISLLVNIFFRKKREHTFNGALPCVTNTWRHTKYTNSTQEYITTKMENTMYEKYPNTLE